MPQVPITHFGAHERARREILGRADTIPPLPEVVTEVLRLLDEKEVSLEDFEAVLQADTALVAKMLRIANSPFYGLMRQLTCVKDAIMVLGFRGLRSLVLAVGTSRFLSRDFSLYGHDGKGLWLHSLSAAAASRQLAIHLGKDERVRSEAFVSGLLHDVGKVFLATFLAELGADFRSVSEAKLVEAERKTLHIDHEEAGQIVIDRWSLDQVFSDVVRHHHAEATLGLEQQELTSIVQAADALSSELGHGFATPDPTMATTCDRALTELGIEDLSEIRADMKEAMEDALGTLAGLASD